MRITKEKMCKYGIKDKINVNVGETNKSIYIEKLLSVFKTTEIGYITINNTEYIIKKEYNTDYIPALERIYRMLRITISEYGFYKKYERRIKEEGYKEHIQVPYYYTKCKKYNIYIFSKLEYDLNSIYLKRIKEKGFKRILKDTLGTVNYLNNNLGVYHNDLHQDGKIRNIMIKNNKIVIIDFGLYSDKLGIKNNNFYNIKSIKYIYNFKIRSELLIIFYTLLINYYKTDIDFLEIYKRIYKEGCTVNMFDKCLLKKYKEIIKGLTMKE